MTVHRIKTDIGVVEFSMTGSGTPILFVHGGHSSCNEELFHKGFDINQFCLITPSRPGYGNTPLTNGTPNYTSELFIAILDHLKLKSVIVIGISAGGLSAIALASKFPDRVAKLVLISAVTKKWLSPSHKTYIKAKRVFSPKIEKYSWGLFRFLYSLFPNLMAKTMFKEISTRHPISFTRDEVAELFAMIRLQRSKEGFTNDLDQNIDSNIISTISCPTLILHSANDNTVILEHAKYAQAQIANSMLKIYPNRWGHLLWLGQESDMPIKDTLEFIGNE